VLDDRKTRQVQAHVVASGFRLEDESVEGLKGRIMRTLCRIVHRETMQLGLHLRTVEWIVKPQRAIRPIASQDA
jgi:hypothetical protein